MVVDKLSAMEMLRMVLEWLDTENLSHAAIDVNQAIERLGGAEVTAFELANAPSSSLKH
jgi:hypothetical protein